MKLESLEFEGRLGTWSKAFPPLDSERTLVVAFGASELIDQPKALHDLRRAYPRSRVIGCSTSGEIAGPQVRDHSLSVAVAKFEHTELLEAVVEVRDAGESRTAGEALAKKLFRPDLRAIFVLSEGLKVNGSELVRGINSVVPESVVVTGGLAGDGTRFGSTWVAFGDRMQSGLVVAVGLYGERLVVGHGSKGGWDKFGPERVVTRSDGNILYELDGKPALALYKEYLGEKAKDLPSSGLLFPLSLRANASDEKNLVRTLLGVDHEKQSMTFAGDVPQGFRAQLMKANFDRLVDGAGAAGLMAKGLTPGGNTGAVLALAVSCVGRRLVLGARTEDEVDALRAVLPEDSHIAGFYSYGEISPYASGHCDLHNQTMTVTTFAENESAVVSAPRPVAKPLPPRPISAPAKPAAEPTHQVVIVVEDEPTDVVSSDGFVVESLHYDGAGAKWSKAFPPLDSERTLVVAFGASELIDQPKALHDLRRAYPRSRVIGCSTSGEIAGPQVRDHSLSVAVAKFEHTELLEAVVEVRDAGESRTAGEALAKKLFRPDLRAIFVLSEGLKVNGSELVRGINSVVPESVVVTGGLAGDGTRFGSTWVAFGDRMQSGLVVAVGLYGERLVVGHGSKGGWDKFGPERVVTRSDGNILYELDGKPALALYKEYLGEKAKELPSSGLLFPLSLRANASDEKNLVRTLLGVDHEKQSMTFAGDVPQGFRAQLMKANFDRLVDGAGAAGLMAKGLTPGGNTGAVLALAVSCVGRRLVLGARTEDEVDALRAVLPEDSHIAGFYSYGEISPYASGHCDLHNQTMTVTTFSESSRGAAKVAARPLPAAPARPPMPRPAAPAVPAAAAASPSPSTPAPTLRVAPMPVATQAVPTPPAVAPVAAAVVAPVAVAPTPPATPATASPAAALTAPLAPLKGFFLPRAEPTATAAFIETRAVGDVTVVKITGRIGEGFQGAATIRNVATANILIDLVEVHRVTSFGVREWLNMLGECERRGHVVALARCTEPVVNQLTMIRGFAGKSSVLSIVAPYVCETCATPFGCLHDAIVEGAQLRKGELPVTHCPRCQGRGQLDDAPETFFGFLPKTPPAPPASLLKAASELPPVTTPDVVEKSIEDDGVRVMVHGDVDRSIRWQRVLDGLEGELRMEFAPGISITGEAASSMEQALLRAEPGVSAIRLAVCPEALLEALATSRLSRSPKLHLASAWVGGHCIACGSTRRAQLDVDAELQAMRAGRGSTLECRRCHGSLDLDKVRGWLGKLGAGTPILPPLVGSTPPSGSASVASSPSAAATSVAPPATAPAQVAVPSASGTNMWVPASVLGGFALIASVLYMNGRPAEPAAPALPPAPTAVVAPVAPAPAVEVAPVAEAPEAPALPPSWTERRIVDSAEGVWLVGHGESDASLEESVAHAREDAVTTFVDHLRQGLAGTDVDRVLAVMLTNDAERNAAAVARRFEGQVGAFAMPERRDEFVRRDGARFIVDVRYFVPPESAARAHAFYTASEMAASISVAALFPALERVLRTEGDVIVSNPGTHRALHAGDVVLSVNDTPIHSADTFVRVVRASWSTLSSGGTMSLQLEREGQPLTLRLVHP